MSFTLQDISFQLSTLSVEFRDRMAQLHGPFPHQLPEF